MKKMMILLIMFITLLSSCNKEEVITPSPTPTNPITTIEIKNHDWYSDFLSETGELVRRKFYFTDDNLKITEYFNSYEFISNHFTNWITPNRVKLTYNEYNVSIWDIETKKDITTYKLIMKNIQTQDTISMWRYIPVTE